LVDDAYSIARLDEAEVIHESRTDNADTGVTCWAHVRLGRTREGFEPQHRAVVMFAGPDIASSGLVIWAPGSGYDEIPTVVGDLVETVCGTRPDGL